MTSHLRLSLLSILLCACTGDPPGETPSAIESLGPSGDYFPMHLQPEFAIIAASFGYDAMTDQAKSVTIDAHLEHPGVLVVLYDRSWNGSLADTTNACQALLTTDGAPRKRAEWVASFPDQLFGFDFGEFAGFRDDCGGAIDPSRYPDFAATLANLRWSVSIAPEMNEEYRQRLLDSGVSESDLGDTIGGGFHGDLGATFSPSGLLENVFTTGFETDDTLVASEPLRQHTRSEMVADGLLQTAYYSVQINLPINAVDQFF